MKKILLKSLLGLLVPAALLAAAPPLATRFEVVNSEKAPVRLTAVEPAIATSDLRLKFRLANTSQEYLPWAEMTVYVYGADGQLRGLHGFTVKANLKAGEERFFLYRTVALELMPGDRVSLVPSVVRLSSRTWSSPTQ